jgi:hypothetical protein
MPFEDAVPALGIELGFVDHARDAEAERRNHAV